MNLADESVTGYAEALRGTAQPADYVLYLGVGDCVLQVACNTEAMWQRLDDYFSHAVVAPAGPDIVVEVVERDPVELGLTYTDWHREPGKTGRKDSVRDFPGGRLVRKVRTGMVFLQSGSTRIAAGPCLRNDNQVINFIIAQYMNRLQQHGWLICHAAGVVRNGHAIGMAGFSGGGKSTLMLHLMDVPDTRFLSNDRLFIKVEADKTIAAGVPKQPRINPGTIINNPRLQRLIPAAQRRAYAAMPRRELWALEQKYDAMIGEIYGDSRIEAKARLTMFVILAWQHDSREPTRFTGVDLGQRRDLLPAVMKSPGPFYQYADGRFYQAGTVLDEQAYLDAFAGVDVYVAEGAVDFTALLAEVNALSEKTNA